MPKRIIFIIIAVVIIALGAIYYFVVNTNDINDQILFEAIPSESPLFINIDEPVSFFKKMNSNEMLNSLVSIEEVQKEFNEIKGFYDFLKAGDGNLLEVFKGKQTILSFNYSGKDDVNMLMLVKMKSKNEMKVTQRIINQIGKNDALIFNSRKYNKTDITEIRSKTETYFIAEQKGIVIFSKKALLVEESIRQIDVDFSIDHPEITPLLKTIGTQSDAQLFINHKQINQLAALNLSKPMKKRSALLNVFAEWTELDLNLKSDKILLSGFSNGKEEENLYGSVFLNQQPANTKVEKVIPQQSAYYLDVCLSDVSQFFLDYEDFLDKRNLLLPRTNQLKKIESTTGVNIQQLFTKIIDKDVVSAGILADQAQPFGGRIWIVETKSGNSAINQIIELQNAFVKTQHLKPAEWSDDYQIDAQTSFTVYRFPFGNLPQLLFGAIFSDVTANWVTVYDNYLIFGDTFQTVTKAVRANIIGETLSGSLEYSKIKADLNSRSNINFYCNTSVALPIAAALFNEKISAEISANVELLKFKTFTWQISSTGSMLYNNACLTYSAELKSKPQTIWQSHIKANFDFKPKFVINHNDPQNKEVALQDKESNFYLINNVGRIIWQIKLDAPILGEVQQIDYFKNGKLQFLFNTKNKLYIVDREGNFVKNFPVNFRAEATNPVSVFDYDNNRDYRLFVACSDKLIYAYQSDGSLVNGWELVKTDHEVSQAVQHFRVEGKDYIVASDLMKDYVLHRTGKVRVKTDQIYPHSVNNILYLEEGTSTHQARMVGTETNGTIHHTYFDGRHETVKNIELSDQHYFVADNIDNDEELEYIFTDKNMVYIMENNGNSVLKKKLDTNISHVPHVYRFSSNVKKIGVTCKSENKIYLFDINGNEHSGFPLDGCTEFSIGFISNDNSNFNLLVGSPEGYLYNYYVE